MTTNQPTPVILDDAALEEIEAREAKASSGPWLVTDGQHIDQYAPHPEGNRLLSEGSYDSNYHIFGQDDVEFIAHARTDIPALCATVRALRLDLNSRTESYQELEEEYSQRVTENTVLREQLGQQRETIKFWQQHIQRMGTLLGTVAMNTEVEAAVKELRQRLAQVEKDLELARQSLLQMTTAVENRS